MSVVENQKSSISTKVIPCIKTEQKYSSLVEKTRKDKETNDVSKVVSFEPQILAHTKSYADVVRNNSGKKESMSKKYSLIDIYPKVKT
jgi:hypothetical protein